MHMRTTIEIDDTIRGRLLELAAARGQKGFSAIVHEALVRYLAAESEAERRRRADAAIAVLGTFDDKAARHLEATQKRLRQGWR